MKREPWREAAVSAALAALVGVLLLATPLGEGFERLSYDLLFALRPDIPVNDVVIVQMDEASHRVLHQPGNGPWDRALHARLIERLTVLGTKAIVFDVLFLGEGDAAADARLVQAARASGRVIVAAQMAPELSRGELVGWRLTRPFAALAEVAPYGVVEEATDDRAVRRHFWNAQYTNSASLAWEAARSTMTQPPAPIVDRWVNYYGPPGWIPRVSYHRAFEANDFSNKVVFVGAGYTIGFTAGKGTDEFRTPYTRWSGRLSPGVELVATTYLNLVRGDWLVRPRPVTECGLILLMAIALGLLTTWRPAAALIVLIVPVAAYFIAWRQHLWFPWLVIVAAQTPCALAFAFGTRMRRLRRENRSLEQRLILTRAAEVARTTGPGTADALAGRVSSAIRTAMEGEPPTPAIPDYELICRIGRGGYGEVWLAKDVLGAHHALKIVLRNRFRDDRPLEREFEGLKQFTPISRSHPNLVQVLHVGKIPEGIYYVMEAADDEHVGQTFSPRTLASLLKHRRWLPLPECLALGIDLASALGFLHQRGLVHRDVKPGNIIFVNGIPKLADIGLVTEQELERNSEQDQLGTPGYMPPEGPGTPAGDVYSLGKLLYETAFGLDCTRFPDLPRSLIEREEENDLFELNGILLKACENHPARRYRNASELREALLQLQQALLIIKA
jgi:CHASE2 domain-containing sensor protein